MVFPKQVLKALKEDGVTFAALTGNGLVTSSEKGISPMMRLLCRDPDALKGAFVGDRVVGKAAAVLALYGGASGLYGELISEHARRLLERSSVPFSYGRLTPFIQNRKGDGMCPMEESVLKIEDVPEAFEILKKKWKDMQKKEDAEMDKEAWKELMERCKEEERELVFSSFNREDAWRLGCLLLEHSKRKPKPVGIQIIINDMVIFRYIPEGVTLNNSIWMERKHNMVMIREMSSRQAQALRESRGQTMEDWLMDPKEYSNVGGGFPIRVAGTGLIGSVCVSGLPAEDDHKLIVETLREYLSK